MGALTGRPGRGGRIAAVGLGVVTLVAIGIPAIVWYTSPGDDARPHPRGPDTAEILGGTDVVEDVGQSDMSSPTPTPGGGPTTPATAGSGGGRTTPPRSYPTTGEAYARAMLNAWTARDDPRIGELASPSAITLMGRAPSGLSGGWEFYDCWHEPFAPCLQMRNDRGDVFSVKVDPARLGRAKAVTSAYRDFTRYESTVLNYLYRAIDAWGAGNTERVAMLVQGHEAVWFFDTIPRQGDHTAFYDFVEYASTTDPVNRTCVQAWVDHVSWIWAIDRRLLGKAHALVWAGGEQVC